MKSENYVIEVHENPEEGICPITDAFKEGDWKTGLDIIDDIDVHLIEDAKYDALKFIEKESGEVKLEIKGQKALLLNLFAQGLIEFFGIKITK